ncbi:MAG: hypothetical protein GY953_42485 [bacterium]|nr:hypothetical protein [bacterium]
MRIRAILILLTVWPLTLGADEGPERILERARRILLRTKAPAAESMSRYMETQRPDGSWTDIDYGDRSRTLWKPLTHLSRVLALSRALENDSGLISAIETGLDYWIRRRPQSDNWWYNEIGTPRAMRDIIILLGDRLDGARLDGCMEFLAQRRMRATGANLMCSAELALHHGAALASHYGSPRREDGLAEGIQEDYSFYQHGARLQSFHYGWSYLDVAVKLGWQLRDTLWQYPTDKKETVTG